MALFEELKRRNVFRVAIAYVVVAWLALQVADVVLNNVEAPAWVFTVIVLVLGIVFPLVLVFAWAFEMTPEGLKREHDVDRTQSITTRTGRKLDLTVIAILTLAVGYFAYDRFISADGGPAPDEFVDRSIAVLPFVNMSSDEEQEYFADGLSEELLNLLAKIPELRVASRSSAFQFKGQRIDISVVAQQLNVAHILEGSVRKDGDRLRITAQLIKADDGFHMWSESYDRELSSVFAIQDEIANAVVDALRVELLGEAPKAAETDPEAYALYLQGRYFYNLGDTQDWTNSVDAYQHALEIDQEYAPAWAGLAVSYTSLADYGVIDPLEGHGLARSAADRAVALDPSLAAAWTSLSVIKSVYDWDWEGAETAIQEALRLEPGNVDAIDQAANVASTLGRLDEAISLSQQAVALDPLGLGPLARHGGNLIAVGRLDEAEAAYRQVLTLDPAYPFTRFGLAVVLMRKNQPAAALREINQESSVVWKTVGLPMALYALGREEEADRALGVLIEEYGGVGAFQIAEAYAFRGDSDAAFEWLERAIVQRDGGIPALLGAQFLNVLHDDPRWEPLLDKVGLLPYWREMN